MFRNQSELVDIFNISTHETYSLSFLVVRTSGSFPNRPTRISFATSPERDEDVEKAY